MVQCLANLATKCTDRSDILWVLQHEEEQNEFGYRRLRINLRRCFLLGTSQALVGSPKGRDGTEFWRHRYCTLRPSALSRCSP